jgi:predicted DNA-binding helix-hairpin-helix protein
MDTQRKLEILAQDAQYDLACACGTRDDEHRRRGVGGKWLYPVTLPNGGRSLLLKTLVSNACTNDCKYCPLRRGSNVERCSMSADEIANIFLEYRRTENVFGLFLTSGVTGTPDQGMERLLDATKLLRRKHQFRGYIHLKILPGASAAAIEEAVRFASAVSLNIETPGREHFAKLSACKDYDRDPKETWARAPSGMLSAQCQQGRTRAIAARTGAGPAWRCARARSAAASHAALACRRRAPRPPRRQSRTLPRLVVKSSKAWKISANNFQAS